MNNCGTLHGLIPIGCSWLKTAVMTICIGMVAIPALAWASPPPDDARRPTAAGQPGVANEVLFDALARLEKSTKQFQSVNPELSRRFAVTLTAREALAAMDEGLLTSAEYVDILIERIEAHPEINAFIHLDTEGAGAAAEEADELRAAGDIQGPLHGLPIVLKDSINTAVMPTTAGTPALEGNQPTVNAPVVQTLVDAGAIVLGKTNLHELSAGFTNNNAFTGSTSNPYALERIPGGSSGGNGAALAAAFAPLAIGEDTGGSVRVPAALTGTMGFRPSTGRYSRAGVVPLSSTLDTLGPMGRDVRDLALADAVITGESMGLEPITVSELRIGVPKAFFRENLDFTVEWAFARVVRRLERAGATLVPADIPQAGEPSLQAFQAISFFEAPRELGAYLAEQDTGVMLEELVGMIASPDVAGLFELAASGAVTEDQYMQVINEALPGLRGLYSEYLEVNDLDVVIYPTTILPAARIGEDETVTINGQPVPTFEAYLHNTHYTPVIGAPTLSLPLGQTREQLPAGGMDIAGRQGDDRRILAVGHAISQILPRVRPPGEIRPRPFPF